MPLDYTPSDGMRNAVSFPTSPANETEAREQFQNMFDQVKNYINSQESPNVSAFRAYQSASQTVPANAWTKVNFQTETHDHQNEYDTANSKFTVKKDGIYLISSAVFWNGSGMVDGNKSLLAIYKNGVADSILSANVVGAAGKPHNVSGSIPIKLATNDYIEVYVHTENSLTVSAVNNSTYFTGIKIA